MHPADWTQMLGSKDSQGQYYGNGPFASQTPPTLWGARCGHDGDRREHGARGRVQDRRTAALARDDGRFGLQQSRDYFVKNLLAVLIEARLSPHRHHARGIRQSNAAALRSEHVMQWRLSRSWRRDPGPCPVCGVAHSACRSGTTTSTGDAVPVRQSHSSSRQASCRTSAAGLCAVHDGDLPA